MQMNEAFAAEEKQASPQCILLMVDKIVIVTSIPKHNISEGLVG
jgi:hypothetical protein